MARKTKWSIEELKCAVSSSLSIRQVIEKLGLIPAGGNYVQIQSAIKINKISTIHFTGKAWRKNKTFEFAPRIKLEEILRKNTFFQSHKLKRRLFRAGIKVEQCELCCWAEQSQDGRIPVELDHINGDRNDNRLENLRILCPNCHSLQTTHRGKNKNRRGGETGRRATLKML